MNYKQTVSITSKPEIIFTALTQNVNRWWGITSNGISKTGDEFTISFGDTHWKFKVTKFVAYKSIAWLCIEAHHVHEGIFNIESEWAGTTIHWDIEESFNVLQLNMSHEGLVPELNCFEVCAGAWNHFILDSLKSYIETGNGKPHLME